jgi:hypothetical protein
VATANLSGSHHANVVMPLERGRVALGRISGTTGTRMAGAVPVDDPTVKPMADELRGLAKRVLGGSGPDLQRGSRGTGT